MIDIVFYVKIGMLNFGLGTIRAMVEVYWLLIQKNYKFHVEGTGSLSVWKIYGCKSM